MDVVTWLRLAGMWAIVYGVLAGVNQALGTLSDLQIPYLQLLAPIISTALNAIAKYIKDQFPDVHAARKMARATRTGQPGLFARVFGV